ncbi:MAG: transposase [Deltaproteobacteria bacterium]|nr:transposase [Deltaproteobacteria bacterium]
MDHRCYDPSLLYHISLRTLEGRWALRIDDQDFQRQIIGALAAAQAATGVRVYAFTFMSNHYHGLFSAEGPEEFAAFLCLLHAATARLVNRAFGRTGPMWHPRAFVQAVLPGENSEMEALRYIVMQAAKAGLVAHPRDWRGASSTRWLLDGEPVRGERIDQTRRTLDARNGKATPPIAAYTETLEVTMSPLPHLAHLGAGERQATLRSMIGAALGAEAGDLPSDCAVDAEGPENARHLPDPRACADLDGPLSDDPAPQQAWSELPTSPPPRRKRDQAWSTCIAPNLQAKTEYEGRLRAFEAAYADAKAKLRCAVTAAARGESAAFVVFPPFGFAPAGRLFLRTSEPRNFRD